MNTENQSIASGLVRELEENAQNLGINCIYLLTESAPGYFERKGYKEISRADVPESIQAFQSLAVFVRLVR